MSTPEPQEPYTLDKGMKAYRVPVLIDVAAHNETEAFKKLNRLMRVLGDREDKSTNQIGVDARDARKCIVGATVYTDQLRQVVAPAVPYPLATLSDLAKRASGAAPVPKLYPPHPDQLTTDDAEGA